MKALQIDVYLIILISILLLNKSQEIIPKKLIHGKTQNETWEQDKFYEYYIDISNYELNEENFFEIYGIYSNINKNNIKLYLFFTDIYDEVLIKNGIIKPNTKKDEYNITSKNILTDFLLDQTYFFLPFKKMNSTHNYLIILIHNIYKDIETLFYISERIKLINIFPKNINNIEAYTKEIKTKSDIRLYYKIDISKINLTKNNFFLFLDKENINEYKLDFYFSENITSFKIYRKNIFILQKNTSDISEIIISIKNKNDYNLEKLVNLWIRIDDNDYNLIYSDERSVTKLYIENINCDKDVFIVEQYDIANNETDNYLILEKFYGNFTLKYYESIKGLNFENFDNHTKIISDSIVNLKGGLVNVFILKCYTPSAFNFEIFQSSDLPLELYEGQSVKTLLIREDEFSETVCLKNLNEFTKYKIKMKILEPDEYMERILYAFLHTQGQDYEIYIFEPDNERTEYIYFYKNDIYYDQFWFWLSNNFYIEYYFTSNKLINNIAEGRTIIDRFLENTAVKIRKDIPFDYISFKAESKLNIIGLYELKLINKEDIEPETNILLVDLPKIWMPKNKIVNLRISNPYNKFDSNVDIDNDNDYYLLFSFKVGSENIILDVEYIYNEQIINLSPIKANIIDPKLEYEINSIYDYNVKDKILFNINKCNFKDNFTLINYYENRNNIIKETQIINFNQIILFDNIYPNSKFKIYKESSELNHIKNEEMNSYPSIYYKRGDILLNYFLIESTLFKKLTFTSDFNITYNEETWSEIILSWKEYVYKNSIYKTKISVPTNYSIYILPKNSVVNTICQLSLIPANKSIINTTEIKLDMDEGEYKVVIIANIIDKEMPFEIMYNFIEINIVKKLSLMLIVVCCLSGVILILIILFLILRKKINLLEKNNDRNDIDELNNDPNSYEEEIFEEDDESTDRKISKGLVNMISTKKDYNGIN